MAFFATVVQDIAKHISLHALSLSLSKYDLVSLEYSVKKEIMWQDFLKLYLLEMDFSPSMWLIRARMLQRELSERKKTLHLLWTFVVQMQRKGKQLTIARSTCEYMETHRINECKDRYIDHIEIEMEMHRENKAYEIVKKGIERRILHRDDLYTIKNKMKWMSLNVESLWKEDTTVNMEVGSDDENYDGFSFTPQPTPSSSRNKNVLKVSNSNRSIIAQSQKKTKELLKSQEGVGRPQRVLIRENNPSSTPVPKTYDYIKQWVPRRSSSSSTDSILDEITPHPTRAVAPSATKTKKKISNDAAIVTRPTDSVVVTRPTESGPTDSVVYTRPTLATTKRTDTSPTLNQQPLHYKTPSPVEAVPRTIAPSSIKTITSRTRHGEEQPFSQLISTKNFISVQNVTYLRLEEIGRGGSSKVYRILGPDHQLYALKKIKLKRLDAYSMAQYENEIDVLKKLQGNPFIIRLIASETDLTNGIMYVVMEHGDMDLNQKLAQMKSEKRMEMHFIQMIWRQMLQAVDAIHEARIVHGDLKPANFLFVNGALKLIDFGIAKVIANDTTNIVRDSQVGTVNFMSPEAIVGNNNTGGSWNGATKGMKVSRASDIWSLGCILYQMVYGTPPFGSTTSLIQKLREIVDPKCHINYPDIGIQNDPLLETIKCCLIRNPHGRSPIRGQEGLLQKSFLNLATTTTKSSVVEKKITKEQAKVLANNLIMLFTRASFAGVMLDDSKNDMLADALANQINQPDDDSGGLSRLIEKLKFS